VKQSAWLVAVALGFGCAPSLTGALCATDCNCPQQQRCVFDGGHGTCADGPNNCGGDAGPALFGTFTLNGGMAKPSGNQARVFAWDHNPALDGGPAVQATVNTDGTWQVYPSDLGQTYWLQGSYELNQGRVVNGGVISQMAMGQAIAIDVPTYQCIVWSELSEPSAAPYLAGLVADVPNITDGTELSTASITATDGVRPVPFMFTLSPHPEDPFDSGKWAWGPLLAGDTHAVQGTYAFTIDAEGYDAGTKCTVNNTSLQQVPSELNVPAMWNTTAQQTVTFFPPLMAQVTYIGIVDANSMRVSLPASLVQIFHPAADGSKVTVTFPPGTLGNVCPQTTGGTQCSFGLLSVHTTFQGPGVNQATSSATAAFYTTN
jgi:hypothetical protein